MPPAPFCMRQEGRSSGASEAPSTEPERLEVELVRDGERLRCEAMSLGFELLSNLAGHVGVLSAETREKGEKDFVDHGCITSNLRYPLRQEIYSTQRSADFSEIKRPSTYLVKQGRGRFLRN